MVLEIRDSGRACTERFRGTSRTALLPLVVDRGASRTIESRVKARNRLGISTDQICVLSIGSAYKYRPIGDLDFLKAAERITKQNDRVCICVVGPDSSTPWDSLWSRTQGRVRVFGRQEDVSMFYEAADVYIEGFPFGSLTALLDARARGLPCVIAPKPVEPPFCSDSPGISDLAQPESIDAYVDVVGNLCLDISQDRQSMECSEMAMHWGQRWLAALENVFLSLPKEHQSYTPSMLEPPSRFLETFWSKFTLPSDSDSAKCCGWSQLIHELTRNNSSEIAKFLPEFVDQAIASVLDRIHSTELRNTAIESLIQSITAVGKTSRCSIALRNFIRLSLYHPRHAFGAFRPRLPFKSAAGI
ncbi:MAG TPA: glycosyltransferase family 4 protein [Planctomycetaceae bacterium]|nr:glycosyltransferase family 4 protein [Planctomycetaceae bacterium]